MTDLTVASVIKLLPENNEQVLRFSKELEDYLDSGDVNPLDVLLCIKGFEKAVKNVKEFMNQLAVDECSKYSEKDIKYHGATLNVVNTGVKYAYDKCGDVEWTLLNSDLVDKNEELKTRETFLKSIKESVDIIDEDTGEVIKIYAPLKTSTTTAKVSLG